MDDPPKAKWMRERTLVHTLRRPSKRSRTTHAGWPEAQRRNDADTKPDRDAGVDLAPTGTALEA